MTTEKVTYRCTGGLERTFVMKPENIIETLDDFIAFDSSEPEYCFSPDCEDCKIATTGIKFVNSDEGHLIKICALTQVKTEGK